MSLRFLSRLAGEQLPYRTTDDAAVQHIDLLRRAQLVVADVPSASASGRQAVVHSITEQGFDLIRRIVKVED